MKPKQWLWDLMELALQGNTAALEAVVNATDEADLERVMHWIGAMPEWQEIQRSHDEQDHSE